MSTSIFKVNMRRVVEYNAMDLVCASPKLVSVRPLKNKKTECFKYLCKTVCSRDGKRALSSDV